MNDKTIEIFKNAPIPKAVLANAIPSIISMMMVLVYNLADTFFIGQTKNAYMVASVSVATPAFLLFMAIGMLFGIGGTSFISRKLGEKEYAKAKQASSFCFYTAGCIGLVGAIFMAFCAKKVALVVGASADTVGYSSQYLQIVALGIPFLIISNSFSNIIRAEGQAKVAMTGMILGNMINIVLDPIMILGLKWYVAGAAIATVLGNVVSALYYIYHVVKKSDLLSMRIQDYHAKDGVASGILAIGIPASLNSVLISTSNILINNMMAEYNDMAVAGLGVAMKVNMLVVMLLIGLGTGIQPLLGYCFGAGNRKRYIDVLKFSTILAFCISMVMTGVCYFGAKFLVTAFLDNADAFDYGFKFSRILIYSGPIIGILFVYINAIQSLGAALPALILNVSRQGLIYIPLLFVIHSLSDSPYMLAAVQPITDYLAATLAIVLFIITFKKYFKKESV